MNEKQFETQLAAANERGLETRIGAVHAIAARYDRESSQLVLTLRGGLTLLVPVVLLQGISGAAPELIERVELWGEGSALHWEELDADFAVQDVAAGSFGVRSWMQNLEDSGLLDEASIRRRRDVDNLLGLRATASKMGQKGGSARTAAKINASRANGVKGGRPRREAAAA